MTATEMATVAARDTIDVRRPSNAGDSAAIIQVIERAAMNPNVDLDKMQRLLDMQERIMARNAKAAYDAAFAVMQPELPIITERGGIKDRNGHVQSTYAKWADINEAVKPVLAAHGFSLRFRIGQGDGKIIVTGILSHREGHSEETDIHLPIDTSGSKNAVQSVGSSTSYGQRYTAKALLNITSRAPVDTDDDGRAGGNGGTITNEQVEMLQQLIVEVGADIQKFCAYMKIDRIPSMPAAQFKRAVDALNAKRARQ